MAVLGTIAIDMTKMRPKTLEKAKKSPDQLYSAICFIAIAT